MKIGSFGNALQSLTQALPWGKSSILRDKHWLRHRALFGHRSPNRYKPHQGAREMERRRKGGFRGEGGSRRGMAQV